MVTTFLCENCGKEVDGTIYKEDIYVVEEHYDCPHCGHRRHWAYGDLCTNDSNYSKLIEETSTTINNRISVLLERMKNASAESLGHMEISKEDMNVLVFALEDLARYKKNDEKIDNIIGKMESCVGQLSTIVDSQRLYQSIGTPNELIMAKAFKEYFDDLYGKGLEVANWHKNGVMESFDSFYDSAIEYGKDKL